MHFLRVIALAASAVAKFSPSNYHTKENHPVPTCFIRESDASPSSIIHLQFMLKQHRFAKLEQHLLEISDPDHQRYGQHFAAHEVHDLVKPRDDVLLDVHDWLEYEGVDLDTVEYNAAKDVLAIDVPVRQAEKMLDTKFRVYRHVEDGSRLVRAPEWKLPKV